MRELHLTDADVQRLVGDALRKKLRAAGFTMGTASTDDPSTYLIPVNLNLAGAVCVSRGEDGIWSFTQDERAISDRLCDSLIDHAMAVQTHRGPIT